jgi:hypothetical protein
VTIQEDLELDYGPAIQGAAALDDAFQKITEAFGLSLNDAVAKIDAAPVETALSGAVDASLGSIVVPEPDTSAVTAGLETAATDGLTDLTIPEPDASAVTAGIDAAVQDADTSVSIAEPDASAVTGAIEGAVDHADTAVTIDEPDASAITDAIEQAAADADIEIPGLNDVGGAADAASSSLDKFKGSLSSAAGVAEVAAAGTKTFEGGLLGLGSKAGPAGIAIGSVVAAAGLFADKARRVEEVGVRLNTVFGDLSGSVQQIHIGPLNTDLDTLTSKLGGGGLSVKSVISNFGDLAQQLGFTREQAASFGQDFIVLAAHVAAVRPDLGDIGQVAEKLGPALTRGGRGLQNLGVGLDEVAVKAKAQEIALSEGRDTISKFDLVVARAQLGASKFAATLDHDVAKAGESSTVQLRNVTAQLGNVIAKAGQPLVKPVTEVIAVSARLAAPLVVALASVLTTLLDVTIGVATVAADLVEHKFSKALTDAREAAGGLGHDMLSLRDAAGASLEGLTEHEKAATGDAAAQGQFASSLKDATAAVGDQAGALQTLPPFFKDAADQAGAYADSLAAMEPKVSEILAGLADDHKLSFKQIQAAFQKQLTDEASFFTNVQTIVAKGGATVAKQILDLGPVRGAAVADAVAKEKDSEITALNQKAVEIESLRANQGEAEANVYLGSLADTIAARLGITRQAAIDLINKTGDAGTGAAAGKGAETGESYDLAVADGIDGHRSLAIEAAAALARLVKKGFEDAVDPVVIGANFGASIAAGLGNAAPKVQSAGGKLAIDTSDAWKIRAHQHSPSQVADELGRQWGESAAAGLEKAERAVQAAAGGLAAIAASALVVPPSVALAPINLTARQASPEALARRGGDGVASPIIVNFDLSGANFGPGTDRAEILRTFGAIAKDQVHLALGEAIERSNAGVS